MNHSDLNFHLIVQIGGLKDFALFWKSRICRIFDWWFAPVFLRVLFEHKTRILCRLQTIYGTLLQDLNYNANISFSMVLTFMVLAGARYCKLSCNVSLFRNSSSYNKNGYFQFFSLENTLTRFMPLVFF